MSHAYHGIGQKGALSCNQPDRLDTDCMQYCLDGHHCINAVSVTEGGTLTGGCRGPLMKRIPGTPFAADFWAAQDGLRYYFLSHLHADHTAGLTDSWRCGTIYCSPITKELLHLKWPGIPDELVIALPVGQTHILWIEDAQHGAAPISMNVSLIEANHCPGAVMFLWEGFFGQLLYTGDFRYHPSMVESGPLARATLAVDTLFVDNTYLTPTFEFPSQTEALAQLVRIIEGHNQYRKYTVLVGIDTLGKERLLIDLATHFRTVVEVPSERYAALRIVHACGGMSDEHFAVFFDEAAPPPAAIAEGAGPLLVLSSRRGLGVALSKRRELLETQRPGEVPLVLGVIPTGWVSKTVKKPSQHESFSSVFRVPYSIHSSYGEILELIRRVRPCRVVPIVPDQPCPFDVIAPLLSGRAPRVVEYPSQGPAAADGNAPPRAPPSRKRPKFGVSEERARAIEEDAVARLEELRRVRAAELKVEPRKLEVKEEDAVEKERVKGKAVKRSDSLVMEKVVFRAKKKEPVPRGMYARSQEDILRLLQNSAEMARKK